MSSVSQIIPNFIGGINDQPDELKKPGQVRDAVNVIPDVVKGLYKRPGYKTIMSTDVGSGTWMTMPVEDNDGDYLFLFHIQNEDGLVRAWNADTGEEQVVKKAGGAIDLSAKSVVISPDFPKLEYFTHDDSTRLRYASKENAIFITNPENKVSMVSSGVVTRPYEAFVEVTVVDESRAYPLTLDFIDSNTGDGVKYSQNVVTKISLDAQVNFVDFDRQDGDGGNCTLLTGIYNEPNETNDERPDATPVSIMCMIPNF